MCGRSSISDEESVLETRFKAKFNASDKERYKQLPLYNICPTTFVPVLSNKDINHYQYFYWGVELQSWNGTVYKNTINARKENILKIPLFQESINERRCLIPATSYFEWKTLNKGKIKIPYLIKMKSLDIFSIGGLWFTQPNEKGEMIEKFVLITQTPTPRLSTIHDRMPAIFTPETENLWLDTSIKGEEAIKLISQPNDSDFEFYPVTKELNKSFDNNPNFIVHTHHEVEEQGSLF